MTFANIIWYVISAIVGIFTTAIPLAVKAREAKNEKANADLLSVAKQFISNAEETFAGFDKMMKAEGSSAGGIKKDTVFSKLQSYALQHGYKFKEDEWADKIDELVKFTKSVNSK